MKTLGLTIVLLQFLSVAYCGQQFTVHLSGRNIPSNDAIWGNSEPYMKVYYKFEEDSNYIGYGQTEVRKGQQNPDWSEQFYFDFVDNPEKIQFAKFELWDKDWMYDDHLGDVVISLAQLVADGTGATDGVVSRAFDTGKGTLLIKTSL